LRTPYARYFPLRSDVRAFPRFYVPSSLLPDASASATVGVNSNYKKLGCRPLFQIAQRRHLHGWRHRGLKLKPTTGRRHPTNNIENAYENAISRWEDEGGAGLASSATAVIGSALPGEREAVSQTGLKRE
jgi:hypothetical protein